MKTPHRVVIIGGGFGGLLAARRLKKAPVEVLLIDRRNFHLFQPLLYQVATGELSPANIASPLRSVLNGHKNVEILMSEVTGIDLSTKQIQFEQGDPRYYDTLILAAGSTHHYFGHDEWGAYAPGLKTIEDATAIRGRILHAFEAAETETDPLKRKQWLTFVVVGGGPTGVELAGALGDMARESLHQNFRTFHLRDIQIILVESEARILPPYPPHLSQVAKNILQRRGVTVRTGASVTDVQADSLTLGSGPQAEKIVSQTMIWAAGVKASPLGRLLSRQAQVEADRSGRIPVAPDLTVPGHPDIFVIGDMAAMKNKAGQPLPAIAPVAMQQGRYVAELIQARLQNKTLPPFAYRHRGTMVTVGKTAAVADLGWVQFNTFLAWIAWLFIHLINLMQFENRLLVLIQWAGYYIAGNRSARLITDAARPCPDPAADKKSLVGQR